MEIKLLDFKKNRAFIESLDVTNGPEFSYEGRIDDDFGREAALFVIILLKKINDLYF